MSDFIVEMGAVIRLIFIEGWVEVQIVDGARWGTHKMGHKPN